MKKIGIGIIGLGGISGKHIKELLSCSDAQIVAIADIDPAAINKKNEELKLPKEKLYTDYRDLIRDPEVEAVEICTPNYLHCEMAIAALKAGKSVNLEKPVAMSYKEAKEIELTAKECGKIGMICFSYRFKPAVRYAKALVEEGRLGKIVGLNVSYLKNSGLWEGRPLEWRFVKEYAGSGVLGDLGVHLVDLAQMLAGEMTEVVATRSVTVEKRILTSGDGYGTVETDDNCSFIAKFSSGAEGSFHITRCALGHNNTISYDVYGERGSISFNLNNPTVLDVCFGEGNPKEWKFQTFEVPKEYYLDQERAFVDALQGKIDKYFPTLSDGAQSQAVIDAILKSADGGKWERIINSV